MKRGRGVVVVGLMIMGVVSSLAGNPGPVDGRDTVYAPFNQGNIVFPPNLWALDILVGSTGFGLGTFYRREITPDLFWFASLSISDAKDDREVERIDPYTGATFTPGKLNRFLVAPLFAGLQRRLFREDITDTFRPFINGGFGPAMVYEMPYSRVVRTESGAFMVDEVDFFEAIGQGTAHFTLGGFIGFGANFGAEQSPTMGVNFRYYIIQLYGDGLPSLYNPYTGAITSRKKDFGGFYLTFHIGTGF